METLTTLPSEKKKKSIFNFWATGADKPVLEDQSKVDSLYSKYRKQVMIGITMGYGAYYTCRLALSVVKKPLIDGGILSAQELGMIGSGLFYGYALGKFTNGFLADHANIRRFMITGLLVSAICNIMMGCSTMLWVFIGMWAVNGWFQGFGAASSVVSLSRWYSNHERGTYYGIWSASHSIGEGLTFVGTAVLINLYGWRAGFIGPGVFCVIMCILMAFLLKDRPQTLGLPSIADWKNDHGAAPKTSSDKTGKMQLEIFKYPAVWVLGLASAMMYVTRYAINSWGILYLQEARGFSAVDAGSLLGINTITGIGGSIAYGFISDKIFNSKRPPANLLFAVFEVLALLVVFYWPTNNYWVQAIAFGVYGFTLSGLLAVLGGLFAVDIVSKRASGAVLGFVGIFSYVAAAIQEQVSGCLIEKHSWVVDGVTQYDFHVPVLFWVGSSVLSMILAASLWNVKMKD